MIHTPENPEVSALLNLNPSMMQTLLENHFQEPNLWVEYLPLKRQNEVMLGILLRVGIKVRKDVEVN